MTKAQLLSGEQAHGVGEARSGCSTFDLDPPGCAGVAVVREPFLLVNEVSAPRAEMERLRLLLAGKLFPRSAPAWSSSPRAIARTNGPAEGLVGWATPPPRIKAPRPNLALMFRKLPEKKHNASKGGPRLRANQSITRKGAPQTSLVRTMPYRIPTVRGTRSKVVPEGSAPKILCRT